MDTLNELLARLRSRPPSWWADQLASAYQAPGSAAPSALAPPAPAGRASVASDGVYELAQRHFRAEEERLKAAAQVSDRLIAGMRQQARPTGAIVQLDARARAARGGVAVVRFVVENNSGEDAEVDLRPSAARLSPAGSSVWLPLSFEPAAPHLAAGARRRVALRLDLRGLPDSVCDALEMEVDVSCGARRCATVFVQVDLDEADL